MIFMKNTNHYLRPIGLFLFLCLIPIWAFAQTISIKGVVNDASGEPIIGASVQEVGTSIGTITDLDGNFTISVSSKGKLKISFIGYKTQEIAVDGKRQFNIVMKEDTEMLDEVVVVGYGQMKRSDLTGSVVSVSNDAIMKSVPTSIDQVLQGRAAGVQIQANTGMPGGSTSIRIRGINSLNASSQPIFVIDGVVIDSATDDETSNPLSSINPSDIVSMDVLKDASATAIYGSRASNGVIIITTKRGETGAATVTYDGYVGWQAMPKHLDVMNLREYAEHHNNRADKGILNNSDYFINPELLGEGTDWQKELFQTALMTSHNLSITGGNEKTTYAIGAGYMNQDGIAIGSGFKRLTLRGNLDTQVNKWLKAGINFSLSDSKQQVGTDNDLIMTALKQTPNVAVRNADGSFDGPDTDQYVQTNPVGMASLRQNYNKKYNFRFNTYLEATLLPGLTFKTELSADYNWANHYYFEPSYQFGSLINETRTGRRTKNDSKYWSWRNIATYNKVFNDVHNLNAMVGQEMSEVQWENLRGTTTGYLSNSNTDIDAGDSVTSGSTGSTGANSLFSFFGRAFYSYDDRYLATFTLRRDGSSKFAENNRWGWFPSAALAWKVSNESFLKDHEVINGLKLRLGWGATGNQNVADWAYMAVLNSWATNWGTGMLNGNTPNPDLKWETTYSTNLGLDISLFKNRIELIADVYLKRTKDLLLQIPLPAYLGSSGYGSASNPWANIGELENKGIELTLNTVNIDTGKFSWRSNLIFSLNRNKVVSMDTESSVINKNLQIGSDDKVVTRTAVGRSIGQFYGYKVIGRFEKATDFYYKDNEGNVKQVAIPKGSSIAESGTWIGDYIFEDRNGDGVITDDDCTYIGNPNPKFTFGIGNTFSWKGFDLTVFLSGSYGNDVLNYARRWLENPRENTNLLRSALNYAVVEKIDPNGPDDFRNLHVTGGDSKMHRLSASSTNENNRLSDRYIEDGSYLRIQNISLGYTFPKRWIQKLSLQNVKVYANLQNVYTWTKYNGYDPEVGSMYGDALMNGLDYGRYPSPRIYTFGLNVSF